jgi:hypothetical protein
MAKTSNSASSKPIKRRSLTGSSTHLESIKDLHPKPDPSKLVPIQDKNPKPDPSKLVPIKDKNPKDKYEPRYVTAMKPQGKSKTEIVPIKTLETTKPGSVSANGGKPRKRKTTNKKY